MRQKLMIDMDVTITCDGIIDIVNEYLQTNYTSKDAKDYYVQSLIPKDKLHEFNKFFYERNLYHYTKLTPDAVEVLKYLNDKYDVYILTAYQLRNENDGAENHLKNKYQYLRETFPFLDTKKFIFTCDKSVVKGDIVVDDVITNLYSSYKQKILFSSYHNQDISEEELSAKGIIRVSSWKEIKELL